MPNSTTMRVVAERSQPAQSRGTGRGEPQRQWRPRSPACANPERGAVGWSGGGRRFEV